MTVPVDMTLMQIMGGVLLLMTLLGFLCGAVLAAFRGDDDEF